MYATTLLHVCRDGCAQDNKKILYVNRYDWSCHFGDTDGATRLLQGGKKNDDDDGDEVVLILIFPVYRGSDPRDCRRSRTT